MLRKGSFLSIASLLLAVQAHALEWDDAFFAVSAGTYYVFQQEDEPYPSSPGVSITAAYHLPVFVEGHTKLIARGQYGWHGATPKVREGKRGASTHRLASQFLIMQDANAGDQLFWWGGGLAVQGRFLTYHYEWLRENGEWDLEIFDDDWIVSPSLLFALHFPLTGQVSVETHYEWSVFDESPHILSLELGYRF